MKAGLEVHQQLATGKLFCRCPSELSEEAALTFSRRLFAASGESRATDAAALHQSARGLTYRYETCPASCLVEMDEEPPHSLDPQALDTALTLARLLDSRPIDELQVMRKIVVDGSNTAGFQRTVLVAVGGHLDVAGRRHEILSICLEEDAARKIREEGEDIVYRLDRLGIPLIEIATPPDLTSGREARELAEELGALLRATGRVRRGIGTIREDLNVSVEGGRRIEIKGVQELRRIGQYVEGEARRQELLLSVRDQLLGRGARVPPATPIDVTPLLGEIDAGPLGKGGRRGGPILALALPGFAGLLRSPPDSEERLGRELADQARAAGLRGLLHSDELPGHGVTEDHIARLRSQLGSGPQDGFVLLTHPSLERATLAIERVARRAADALEGVPAETRDPLPDGRTRYSRPLPGRHRMYPETDVAPIPIREDHLRYLDEHLPERPSEMRTRFQRIFGLSPELIGQIVSAGRAPEFENLVLRKHAATRVARLLTQELPGVSAGPEPGPHEISLDDLDAVLSAVEAGRFAKEGIPDVLRALSSGAATLEEALGRAGLEIAAAPELRTLVDRIVAANREVVRVKGEEAFSPLMGDVMKEARGRYDGREVARLLRESIERARADPSAPGRA